MAEASGTGRDIILGADDACFGTRNTNENSSRLSSQHPVLGQSGRGTALIDRHPDHTRKALGTGSSEYVERSTRPRKDMQARYSTVQCR